MISTRRIMGFTAAWRSIVSLAIAGLLLWALARRQLIEARTLIDVAGNAPGTLAVLAILLLLPLVLGALRYHAVLRAMARDVPLPPIIAANFVSAAVSNWLPASAGFQEVIRFGLLARATRSSATAVSRLDLAVVALVDRLLGLATVALVGSIGGLYLLTISGMSSSGGTGFIVAGTLLLAAGCVLPFVAVRVPQIERAASRLPAMAPFGLLQRVMGALRQVRLRRAAFAEALIASLGISGASILATYLAMRLFVPATPVVAVAIAFPVLTVAGLLPGSVAGFGSNQVAAALVFAALALDPKAAVLASLLVSAVGLVASSIAGAVYAPRAWQDAQVSQEAAAAVPSTPPPGHREGIRD